MSCPAQSCCPPALFPDPIPQVGEFFNTEQPATACCPEGYFNLTGNCKTAIRPAGTVTATTQQEANDIAYALALADAQSQLDCSCGKLTPDMTDYEAPSGEVLYSSDSVANAAWHAFDGNLRTETSDPFWHSSTVEDPTFIGYKFPAATIVKTYRIYPYADAEAGDNPTAWVFEGSNDGTTWTELDAQEDIINWEMGVAQEFPFINVTAYEYYRLRITEVEHERAPTSFPGLTPAIGELQLFPCHPLWFPDPGVDPVRLFGPPTNYWATVHEDGSQPRITWTAPDIMPTGEAVQIVPELLIKVKINNFVTGPLATMSQTGTTVTLFGNTFAFDEASKYVGAFILFEDGTTRTIVSVDSTTTATVSVSGAVTEQGFSLVLAGQTFHLFWFDGPPPNPALNLLESEHTHAGDMASGLTYGAAATFGNVDGFPTFDNVVLPIESTEPYTKEIWVYVAVSYTGVFLISPPVKIPVVNPPP